MALFLLLILAAIVLGLIGVVAETPYLLAIGILVLVADLLQFSVHWSRQSHRHPVR
jgi:hypothetical protein